MAHRNRKGEAGYIAEGAKARTGKAAHANIDSSFTSLGTSGMATGKDSLAGKTSLADVGSAHKDRGGTHRDKGGTVRVR